VHANYTLVLNALGLVLTAALFGLTARRGATDPVCGMTVDRARAVTLNHEGRTLYFCCEGCRAAFVKAPDRYVDGAGVGRDVPAPHAATVHGGRHGNAKHDIITLPGPAVHGHDD